MQPCLRGFVATSYQFLKNPEKIFFLIKGNIGIIMFNLLGFLSKYRDSLNPKP